MSETPQILKVQVVAEFVLPDGEYLIPGTFGPVEMTAREWAEFDLQAAVKAGVARQAQPDAEAQKANAPPPNRAARRAKKPRG